MKLLYTPAILSLLFTVACEDDGVSTTVASNSSSQVYSSLAVSSAVISSSSSVTQTVQGGSISIPKTPQTILVGAGSYSPSYSASCTGRKLLMQDCSVTIGNVTMSSIEIYTGLPTSLIVNNSSCVLSCQ